MEECGSGREKSETNPSNHPSCFTHRKTSTTNLTSLKPAEDFFFFSFLSSFSPEFLLPFCPSFFLFLLPSILYLFYSFFLPSLICFILIFVKILSYPASNLSLFLLPSFLSFSIPFFPPSLFLPPPFSLFPTGETIKPGVLKTPELDLVTPINVSSRPVSTGD